MISARILFALTAALSPMSVATAQSPAKLKAELKTMEAAAKKDPEAWFAAARWAAEKGMAADAKRLYQQVLKLAPDHEGANAALGFEKVDGKWLPAKEAAAARKKAMAAEYAAKGFVEVDGVWVDKAEVDDAKRGVFRHEGETVTKEEKLALMSGRVRHPETGELIDAKDLERAQNRYFPIGSEGRWVDEKEANTYHSDLKRPWIVRSGHCTIVSTLELSALEEVRRQADRGVLAVEALFGGVRPVPANRPVLLVAATEAEYREFGQAFGEGSDAAGAFLMREEAKMRVPLQGEVRTGICYFIKGMGPFYVRHAAAIAYANAIAVERGIDLPLWALHGIGALASRFENDSDAGWFGKALAQRGGARNLKAFFAGFAISGEMEPTEISIAIYQAGLMFAFAMKGGEPKVTEAMVAVTDVLAGKKKGGFDKALTNLQTELAGAEPAIEKYLQSLLAQAPK